MAKKIRELRELRGGLTPATADGSVHVSPMESRYEPRNQLQRDLARVWPVSDFIILTGESGTGKTSGGFGMALADLLAGRIRKIIVTRPPVSQGPGLGFFKGDLNEKMTPWLGSVSDSLEGFSNATFEKMGAKLEILDLGTVQGRTVRDAVLIVDEASNLYSREYLPGDCEPSPHRLEVKFGEDGVEFFRLGPEVADMINLRHDRPPQ